MVLLPPAQANARLLKNSEVPLFCKNAPNNMKRKINVADTVKVIPNKPSSVKYIRYKILVQGMPLCARMPGK